jgi:hypothetical protein
MMKKTAFTSLIAASLILSSLSWASNGFETFSASAGETKAFDLGERGDREDERIVMTLTNKSDKTLSVEVGAAMGVLICVPQIDGLMLTKLNDNGEAEPFAYYNSESFTLYSAAEAKAFDSVKAKDMVDGDLALIEHDLMDGSTFTIVERHDNEYRMKASW